jgi:nitrate/nitrite transport system substrate-binding protein
LFHNDGKTNFPRKSYGIWFLTQYVRFGRLKQMPANYEKMVDDILLQDLYKEVAREMAIKVPNDDMTPFTVDVDQVLFNPAKPMDALKTYVARENFLRSRLA